MAEEGKNAFFRVYADRFYLDRANRDVYLERDVNARIKPSAFRMDNPQVNEAVAMAVTSTNLNLVDDVDFLAELLQRGTPQFIQTAAGWTTALVGSGTVTQHPVRLALDTFGTANSSATVDAASSGLDAGGGQRYDVDWSKKLRILFVLSVVDVTAGQSDGTVHIALKPTAAIGALAGKGVGLKVVNLALTGESYNTALGSIALATLVANRSYLVEIRHYPGVPKIEFWVNGVLAATQSTSANIPQTGLAGDAYSWVISIENTVTGQRRILQTQGIFVGQEE